MPTTDTDIRTYYREVLGMLEQVARREHRGRRDAVRTSDVVQEVFLRIEPQLRSRQSLESLVPLAATIARRWLIDCARKKRPAPVDEQALEGALHSLRRTGIEPLDLQTMLESLDPAAREIVDLRIFAGLEIREIIAVSGATEHFVRTTLKTARARLERLANPD